MNLDGISTKLGAVIPASCVPNFSLTEIRIHLHFMTDFAKCTNRISIEEGKIPYNVGLSFLQNGWGDFIQIWYGVSPTGLASFQQNWS